MLFKPRAGEPPEETAMRDREEGPLSPPDPEKEALKQKVAKALVEHDKTLEVFKFDYREIARIRKMTIEQARQEFRHIELNDESTGMQITLFDDEASISVPYWHQGEKAQTVFRRMLDNAAVICREAGYVVFDPQSESVIDPGAEPEEMVGVYTSQVGQLRADTAVKSTRRPWWKFW